jgi:uncharacterized protein with HEPN domain
VKDERDRFYLLDIADSIMWIETVAQQGRDAFRQARLSQDAVLRNFEIIGEAVKRISAELKDAYPLVPWRRGAGLRDVLIHEYRRVDLNVVWQIMERDLPQLKQQVAAILQDLGPPLTPE